MEWTFRCYVPCVAGAVTKSNLDYRLSVEDAIAEAPRLHDFCIVFWKPSQVSTAEQKSWEC